MRREINRLLGRVVSRTDVEQILCGDRRVDAITSSVLRSMLQRDEEPIRVEFIRMVNAILSSKESEKRARQAETRANLAVGHPP